MAIIIPLRVPFADLVQYLSGRVAGSHYSIIGFTFVGETYSPDCAKERTNLPG